MAKPKKKRTKKYQKKPLHAPAQVMAYLIGEETDKDAAFLREVANVALDAVQLGTREVEHFWSLLTVMRNLYVVGSLYEEYALFKKMMVLGRMAVLYMWDSPDELTIADRDYMAEVIQLCINTYFQMAGTLDRATLIKSQYFTEAHREKEYMDFTRESYFVIFPDGQRTGEEVTYGKSGWTVFNGEMSHGVFNLKQGKPVWIEDNGPTRVIEGHCQLIVFDQKIEGPSRLIKFNPEEKCSLSK